MWAECKVRESIATAWSGPAVIQLGENGEIEKVIIPRDVWVYSRHSSISVIHVEKFLSLRKFDISVVELLKYQSLET